MDKFMVEEKRHLNLAGLRVRTNLASKGYKIIFGYKQSAINLCRFIFFRDVI